MKIRSFLLFFLLTVISRSVVYAQPVTGFWEGKIDHKNVELHMVKNGDSLTGTSYYYTGSGNYRRYSIKGYFDPTDNSVVWWDDQLIEEKSGKGLFRGRDDSRYVSSADFNCPGGARMYLRGKAALKERPDERHADVELEKFLRPYFRDEWDYVIENYTVGGNDPDLIDSIGRLSVYKLHPADDLAGKSAVTAVVPNEVPSRKETSRPASSPRITPQETHVPASSVLKVPLTNLQKLMTRSRHLVEEIPVTGDSIELKFYDDAEIDGDSIAVFLNDKMLAQHIRLSDTPFIMKLPVAELQSNNELVMVAENLGSIPPNTSLMIAMVAGKRYEARLASTEESSAVVRFVRNGTTRSPAAVP